MKIFLFLISIILFASATTFAQEKRADKKVETQKIAQADRPLKITKIPRPKHPEKGTAGCISGNVKIRVQFLASGKIGEVTPVSESGCAATDSAIESARNITFEPAIKAGKPVTVHKVVVISFNIY